MLQIMVSPEFSELRTQLQHPASLMQYTQQIRTIIEKPRTYLNKNATTSKSYSNRSITAPLRFLKIKIIPQPWDSCNLKTKYTSTARATPRQTILATKSGLTHTTLLEYLILPIKLRSMNSGYLTTKNQQQITSKPFDKIITH